MSEKILIVDDEPNVLAGLTRHLRRQFDVSAAPGGRAAVAAIKEYGPFAVVVCDMRMPGMDGVETLREIKEISPETTRMMLTGNADQQTAVDAINEGNIFRFFTKPCPHDVLERGILAGIHQHRLVMAERELLEKTLAGSVKILIDVLSMVDPEAFGRSTRLKGWARKVATELACPSPWQIEIAAMLSPIGRVSVPPELLAKLASGGKLSTAEREILDRTPEAGRNLIVNIPRLQAVAEIVYFQAKGFDGSGFPDEAIRGEAIPLGARILKLLGDLAATSERTLPSAAEFQRLESRAKLYDPRVWSAARRCLEVSEPVAEGEEECIVELPVGLLLPGQILKSDIKLENGRLVLAAPAQLSEVQVQRLRNLIRMYRFQEPVRVVMPRSQG